MLCYALFCVLSSFAIIFKRERERERERERAISSTLFAFLVSCDCYVALSHEALGLSAVCDYGISWSYSLVFLHL